MKKIFTLLLFAVSFTLMNAQSNADLSLDYLKVQQNKAIENENYEAAAKYKKAIELKAGIKDAVDQENWDKAAQLKSELNDINFKGRTSSKNNSGEYSGSDGLKDLGDRDFMDGGFFLDGMVGVGFLGANGYTTDPNVALNFQFGTKWHFGEGRVYRPGLQMTWLRLGIQKAATNTFFSLHMYPVNVGYASIFGFTDEMGMEVNVNFGLGLNFILGSFPDYVDVQTGFHFNPNVKFRYNSFAVGFDVSTLNGPMVTSGYSTWFNSNMYSVTIGAKF